MGPGARHDTIDDQFGGHNWRKITSSGDLLHKRLERVMTQVAWQLVIHVAFTESLPMEKNWAQEWTKQVDMWERNNDVVTPAACLSV
ncbi:uncharacterized protein ARMOST_20338 [Armillaria ostoyae]|uniref:Uncharacterized protein n=1 Tax=Armillaria ostoyae TaxID=47428 RepID=A0A284S736_ARMOS|nr:uncharacterized protein ARMOST_20338 [Armillaria ostoyae]